MVVSTPGRQAGDGVPVTTGGIRWGRVDVPSNIGGCGNSNICV